MIAPPEAGGWLRRLAPLFRRHRRNLTLAFGGSLVGMVATVLGPLVLRRLIDEIAAGRAVPAAGLAALLGLGIVRFAASVGRRLFAGRVCAANIVMR